MVSIIHRRCVVGKQPLLGGHVGRAGGGTVDFLGPKPGQEGDTFLKSSYALAFEPWQLVLVTGVYVDDLQAQIRSEVFKALSFGFVILLLGSTGLVPLFKMGVPQAMIIGAILTLVVTRSKPQDISDAFFEGMGKAYGKILGIIISAGVFVAGLTAIGLVKFFIELMLDNPAIVKLCAAFGPFLLGLLVGSGDAATFAFNEAITPYAQDFGMTEVQMGSMATLGGTLGRTMSPIAGATIICAGIAGVNPMEITKRNAIPMLCALLVGMFILLYL